MIAVNQFVQNQMPLRIIFQIGGGDELFEIGAMIVDIPRHPHFPFARQMHHLHLPQRAELVLVRRRYACCNFNHG